MKTKGKYPYVNYIVYISNPTTNGRRYVTLRHIKTKKDKFMSLARYKLSIKLGRRLLKNEQADHIDEDPTNDRSSNLQVLSGLQNLRKHIKRSGKSSIHIRLKCPICKVIFYREPRQVRFKIKSGGTPTCSRTCGSKFGNMKKRG